MTYLGDDPSPFGVQLLGDSLAEGVSLFLTEPETSIELPLTTPIDLLASYKDYSNSYPEPLVYKNVTFVKCDCPEGNLEAFEPIVVTPGVSAENITMAV